ncbi:outer membrane lipoprotein carrier protein LolA [uncultured Desulfobulbus sp.]|uniref:LolA family protein n=1 Tax=uncultured Desulfobulbus sp. TaxID=239745 RepID=UPI0029C99490|nr:outer membrane lipoprotein carrier protein LolA [uncultured Desulfobulbus sp.]
MFNRGRFILVLFLLSAFGSLFMAPSAEAASGLEQRVLQLQKKYQQLRSLEFEFSQSTQTGGRVKQGAGNAVFFRPGGALDKPAGTSQGIMRWNYIEPTAQTIINDGKELSIYTPQDKQLIVSPAQDMESDITYAIFTGTKSLLDEFEASPADKLFILSDPPAGFDAILLTPRQPHPQVKRVQLWLNGDFTIHRLLMEDHFGALTELTFAKVRINTLPQGDVRQVQALLKLDLVPGTETIRP